MKMGRNSFKLNKNCVRVLRMLFTVVGSKRFNKKDNNFQQYGGTLIGEYIGSLKSLGVYWMFMKSPAGKKVVFVPKSWDTILSSLSY